MKEVGGRQKGKSMTWLNKESAIHLLGVEEATFLKKRKKKEQKDEKGEKGEKEEQRGLNNLWGYRNEQS